MIPPALRSARTYLSRLNNLLFAPRAPGAFLREAPPAALRQLTAREEPTLRHPGWQLPTVHQMREPIYAEWCAALHDQPALDRKQWEWVYILEVLRQAGMLAAGVRGLGFGCGREPLIAIMASRGCTVLATDLDVERAAKLGWVETSQHTTDLASLNDRRICGDDVFARQVSFRNCDMNAIPADLRAGQFDFTWSACSLEHLGTLEHGLAFIEQSLECVRPGGIAVHTTEFNLGSNEATLDSGAVCAYRKRDIEALALRLVERGHRIGTINLQVGTTSSDKVIDLPPYRRASLHMKLTYRRHLMTSIGLFVHRAG